MQNKISEKPKAQSQEKILQGSENSERLANLKKQNHNLVEQAQKYALMLSEEKAEKKAVRERYDKLAQKHETLNQDFQAKQQLRMKEKIKLAIFIFLYKIK